MMFRPVFSSLLQMPLIMLFAMALACGGAPSASDESGSTTGAHDHPSEPEHVLSTYSGDYPIKVVATTGMIGDILKNIGGDHLEVHTLMGEGVDPHLYKTTPSDLQLLQTGDIIFYNGLHLEAKMSDVLLKFARRSPTFAVSEQLDPNWLREPPEMEGQYDPHIWFNVALWADCARFTGGVLEAFDPVHADDYVKGMEDYTARLKALDTEVRSAITSIPEAHRILVTAHDAFGYFGDAYGIEVLGVQGMSTESEAGVRRVNELVGMLVERNVKAIFVESSVSDKNMKALVEGCKARGHEIRIGGELFSDAMGSDGTPEGTYEGMVRHNVKTIAEALK